MEQDYVFSLNFHSKNPAFREKLTKTQDQIANEIFDQETLNPVIPESLTEQVATEIRDFARDRTNEIIGELSQKIKDPNLLQEKVSFEIAKLDDIIYLKHGYRNKVVIKAFEKFNLLGKQVPTANTTAAVVN
jgi:glutaredoxin 2